MRLNMIADSGTATIRIPRLHATVAVIALPAGWLARDRGAHARVDLGERDLDAVLVGDLAEDAAVAGEQDRSRGRRGDPHRR